MDWNTMSIWLRVKITPRQRDVCEEALRELGLLDAYTDGSSRAELAKTVLWVLLRDVTPLIDKLDDMVDVFHDSMLPARAACCERIAEKLKRSFAEATLN